MATATTIRSSTLPATATFRTSSSTCSPSPVAALTSIFTPPADCPSPLSTWRPSCLPTKYSEYWTGTCSLSISYYSPGICPSGYTGQPRPTDFAPGFGGPPLSPEETAAMCCPPPYKISTAFCWNGPSSAYGLQVRWQSSDLSVLETHPLSPGVKYTSSTTSSLTSSTTPASLEKTSEAAVDSGLGTGAKAGIGLGAVFGVLALLAGGFLLWRRSRRYAAVENTSNESSNDAPEMVTRNWNEGHDLPVVVEDKKGPTTTSAGSSLSTGKIFNFFGKSSPASSTAVALSGRNSPNGKEVLSGSNAQPLAVPPPYAGIQSSDTPRHSRQFIPESGLEVMEHHSPAPAAMTNEELEALRQEHQRIQDERQRLSRLQALDEEERRVRQWIEQMSSPRQ
ncbi:hypothetical protein FKW77_008595 [Venturia effusa]|uniref:Uncharacterized protein n=1 Tax=Venturia effusa TaxID=50376 RepID=A0A517LJL8_9PEZI|nr:hypothetical protein FKW77_008595 [Venturia effusa]